MTRLNRKERINVLWVEDGAAVEVPQLTPPLFSSSRYNLVIAKDASNGLRWLTQTEMPFQVVVFDLHLAPGDDQRLIDRYQKPRSAEEPQHPIGLSILIDLFDPSSEEPGKKDAPAPVRPDWLTPDRVGLLTVEPITNVKDVMDRLGIDEQAHKQKEASMTTTALKDLVDSIYKRITPPEPNEVTEMTTSW